MVLKKKEVDRLILAIADLMVAGSPWKTVRAMWLYDPRYQEGGIKFTEVVGNAIAKIGKYALDIIDKHSDTATRRDIMLHCFAGDIGISSGYMPEISDWEREQLVKTVKAAFAHLSIVDDEGYFKDFKNEEIVRKLYNVFRVRKNRYILWNSEHGTVVCQNLYKIIEGCRETSVVNLCSGIELASQFLQEFDPKYIEESCDEV